MLRNYVLTRDAESTSLLGEDNYSISTKEHSAFSYYDVVILYIYSSISRKLSP
jgi:hypothetical protein